MIMNVERKVQPAHGLRFSNSGENGELARASLYLMTNDLRTVPFGLLEAVSLEESPRGSGLGPRLIQEGITAAREAGWYTLIAMSRALRHKVQALYRHLGFEEYGVEF